MRHTTGADRIFNFFTCMKTGADCGGEFGKEKLRPQRNSKVFISRLLGLISYDLLPWFTPRRDRSESQTTRALLILVAPLTAREHKRIFLLCYYFANPGSERALKVSFVLFPTLRCWFVYDQSCYFVKTLMIRIRTIVNRREDLHQRQLRAR